MFKYLKEKLQGVKAAITGLVVTAAVAGTALVAPPAHAQATSLTAAAQEGIYAARDDALTVGGYVILAGAALLVVMWILTMMKKR